MTRREHLAAKGDTVSGESQDPSTTGVAQGFLAYKVGHEAKQGPKVAFIYGATADVIVYRGADGITYYDTTGLTLTPVQLAANARYDALFDQMRLLVPFVDRTPYEGALARALFGAMCESDLTNVDGYYTNAQLLLDEAALKYGRAAYLTSASFLAALLGLLAAFSDEFRLLDPAKQILQAGGTAAAGAWASVIQRASSLDFKRSQSTSRVAAEGFMRIVLGAIFGGYLVFLVKGNLAFPLASGNIWTLMSFAFIAGISERFIPGIIADIEKQDPKQSVNTPSTSQAPPTPAPPAAPLPPNANVSGVNGATASAAPRAPAGASTTPTTVPPSAPMPNAASQAAAGATTRNSPRIPPPLASDDETPHP